MKRKVLKYLLGAVLSLLVFIFVTDYWVSHSVEKQLRDNIQTIEHHKVGLLLGTSKYVSRGKKNLFYKHRIAAAVKLFKAGKIDFILVSGDNRQKDYNEPVTMKADLIAAGVPEDRIVLDYAGFRTLDSVVRCKAIFGESDIIIISQRFHNERALCIANRKGLNAIAYNAQDPPRNLTVKVRIREKLARVKMLLDLLTNKQPHFYGEKIEIKETEPTEPNFEDYPKLKGKEITVTNIEKIKWESSSDKRDYDSLCSNWVLNKKSISDILSNCKPINGVEWHHLYAVLICGYKADVMIDSIRYELAINAGAFLTLSDSSHTYLYGCEAKTCDQYFLAPVWREDGESVDFL